MIPQSLRSMFASRSHRNKEEGDDNDDEERGKKEAKAVFADAQAMKEKVRQAIGKPEYNVANFYYETGCLQAIARHPRFEQVTSFIIAFNAIWIAVDTDQNEATVLA